MTREEAIDKITDSLDGNHDGSVNVYSSCGPELVVRVCDKDGDPDSSLEFKITIKEL